MAWHKLKRVTCGKKAVIRWFTPKDKRGFYQESYVCQDCYERYKEWSEIASTIVHLPEDDSHTCDRQWYAER
jgi:hypothetical protein